MAATNVNGTNQAPAAVDTNTIADDIARLDTLLSQSELSTSDDADVAELLQRLDTADGVAGDLELKLDGILAKLDGILDSMDVEETESAEVTKDATDVDTNTHEA